MDTANAMSIPRVDVEAEKRHAADDYYGLPAIKRSHYRWTAGTSFFLAGIAGVIEMLTRILYVSGHANDEKLVRAGTYLVPAVTGAAALLYIKDLGTPSRWFNMLRIFRPTSFMSVGSWSLTTLGIKSGIAAIMQYFSRTRPRGKTSPLARLGNLSGLLPASLLSFYMGGELEETSTPFWSSSAPLFPPLFAASNFVNALAVLELLSLRYRTSHVLRSRIISFTLAAGIAELLLLRMVEGKWLNVNGDTSVRASHVKLLYGTGFVSLARIVSMILRISALKGRSRTYAKIGSILTLVSGFFLPTVLLLAGNRSADKPREYLYSTDHAAIKVDEMKENAVQANRPKHSVGRLVGIGFAAACLTYIVANRSWRR